MVTSFSEISVIVIMVTIEYVWMLVTVLALIEVMVEVNNMLPILIPIINPIAKRTEAAKARPTKLPLHISTPS